MIREGFQTLRQWKDQKFREDPEIADLVDEIEEEEERQKQTDDGFPEHDRYDEESEP